MNYINTTLSGPQGVFLETELFPKRTSTSEDIRILNVVACNEL